MKSIFLELHFDDECYLLGCGGHIIRSTAQITFYLLSNRFSWAVDVTLLCVPTFDIFTFNAGNRFKC